MREANTTPQQPPAGGPGSVPGVLGRRLGSTVGRRLAPKQEFIIYGGELFGPPLPANAASLRVVRVGGGSVLRRGLTNLGLPRSRVDREANAVAAPAIETPEHASGDPRAHEAGGSAAAVRGPAAQWPGLLVLVTKTIHSGKEAVVNFQLQYAPAPAPAPTPAPGASPPAYPAALSPGLLPSPASPSTPRSPGPAWHPLPGLAADASLDLAQHLDATPGRPGQVELHWQLHPNHHHHGRGGARGNGAEAGGAGVEEGPRSYVLRASIIHVTPMTRGDPMVAQLLAGGSAHSGPPRSARTSGGGAAGGPLPAIPTASAASHPSSRVATRTASINSAATDVTAGSMPPLETEYPQEPDTESVSAGGTTSERLTPASGAAAALTGVIPAAAAAAAAPAEAHAPAAAPDATVEATAAAAGRAAEPTGAQLPTAAGGTGSLGTPAAAAPDLLPALAATPGAPAVAETAGAPPAAVGGIMELPGTLPPAGVAGVATAVAAPGVAGGADGDGEQQVPVAAEAPEPAPESMAAAPPVAVPVMGVVTELVGRPAEEALAIPVAASTSSYGEAAQQVPGPATGVPGPASELAVAAAPVAVPVTVVALATPTSRPAEEPRALPAAAGTSGSYGAVAPQDGLVTEGYGAGSGTDQDEGVARVEDEGVQLVPRVVLDGDDGARLRAATQAAQEAAAAAAAAAAMDEGSLPSQGARGLGAAVAPTIAPYPPAVGPAAVASQVLPHGYPGIGATTADSVLPLHLSQQQQQQQQRQELQQQEQQQQQQELQPNGVLLGVHSGSAATNSGGAAGGSSKGVTPPDTDGQQIDIEIAVAGAPIVGDLDLDTPVSPAARDAGLGAGGQQEPHESSAMAVLEATRYAAGSQGLVRRLMSAEELLAAGPGGQGSTDQLDRRSGSASLPLAYPLEAVVGHAARGVGVGLGGSTVGRLLFGQQQFPAALQREGSSAEGAGAHGQQRVGHVGGEGVGGEMQRDAVAAADAGVAGFSGSGSGTASSGAPGQGQGSTPSAGTAVSIGPSVSGSAAQGASDDLLVVKPSGEITGAMELYGMRGAAAPHAPDAPAAGDEAGPGGSSTLTPHVLLHVGSPTRLPPPLESPRTPVPVTVEDLPPPTALGGWVAGVASGALSPRAQVQAAAASPVPRMSGSGGGGGGGGGSGGSGGSGGTLRLPMMQAVLTGCVETIQKTAAEQLRAQEVGMLDQEVVQEEMIDAGPGLGAAAVTEIEPVKESASEGLRQVVHGGVVGQGEAGEGAVGQQGLEARQRDMLLAVEAEAVAAGDALVSAGLAAAPEAEVIGEGGEGGGGATGEVGFGMDEGQLRALKAAAMEGAQQYMAMGMGEQEEVEDRVERRGDGAEAGAGGESGVAATAAELPGAAARGVGVAVPAVTGKEPREREVPIATALEGSSAATTPPPDTAAATLKELLGSVTPAATAPQGGSAAVAVALADTAALMPEVVATAAAAVPVPAAALDSAAKSAGSDAQAGTHAPSGAEPSAAPTPAAAPDTDTALGPTPTTGSVSTTDTAAIAPPGSPSSSLGPQPPIANPYSPGAAHSSLTPPSPSAPGTPAAKVPVTLSRYAANASSAPLPLSHTASGASATVASLAAALAAAMARATAAASATASAQGWQPAPGSGGGTTLSSATGPDADPESSLFLSGILFSSTKPPAGGATFDGSPARAVPVSVTHDTGPDFADAPGSPTAAAASPPSPDSLAAAAATSTLPTLGKYGKRGSRRRRLVAAARVAPAIHLDAIPEISEQGESVEALEEDHENGDLLLDRGGSNTSYGSADSEVSGAGEGDGGEEEVVTGPASGERQREDEGVLETGEEPNDAGVGLGLGGGSAAYDGAGGELAQLGLAAGNLVPAVEATPGGGSEVERAGGSGGAAGVLAAPAASALADAAAMPTIREPGSGATGGPNGEIEELGVAGPTRPGAGPGTGLVYKGPSKRADPHSLFPAAAGPLWVPALGQKRAQAAREAEPSAVVVPAASEALPTAASRSVGDASSGGGGAQGGSWGLLGWPVKAVGSGVRVMGGTVAAAADHVLQATSGIPEELPQEHPTALWGHLPWPLGLVARLAAQVGVGALAAALAGAEVAAALLLPGWVRTAGPVEPVQEPTQMQGLDEPQRA